MSFHIVALLVVGLLASRIGAARVSGKELKETAKTLANLRVLHERIVGSIRSGLVTTDLDGTIYAFNVAATEITGHRLDEVQGRSISRLFGDIQEQINLSLEAVGDGDPHRDSRRAFRRPTDSRCVSVTVSLLFSQNNEATGLIIIVPGPHRDSFDGGDRPSKGSARRGRPRGRRFRS